MGVNRIAELKARKQDYICWLREQLTKKDISGNFVMRQIYAEYDAYEEGKHYGEDVIGVFNSFHETIEFIIKRIKFKKDITVDIGADEEAVFDEWINVVCFNGLKTKRIPHFKPRIKYILHCYDDRRYDGSIYRVVEGYYTKEAAQEAVNEWVRRQNEYIWRNTLIKADMYKVEDFVEEAGMEHIYNYVD